MLFIIFWENRLYRSCCMKQKFLSYRQNNDTSNKILTSFPIFEILQLEVRVQQTDRYIQRRTQRTWMNCHSWKRQGKKIKAARKLITFCKSCSTNLWIFSVLTKRKVLFDNNLNIHWLEVSVILWFCRAFIYNICFYFNTVFLLPAPLTDMRRAVRHYSLGFSSPHIRASH